MKISDTKENTLGKEEEEREIAEGGGVVGAGVVPLVPVTERTIAIDLTDEAKVNDLMSEIEASGERGARSHEQIKVALSNVAVLLEELDVNQEALGEVHGEVKESGKTLKALQEGGGVWGVCGGLFKMIIGNKYVQYGVITSVCGVIVMPVLQHVCAYYGIPLIISSNPYAILTNWFRLGTSSSTPDSSLLSSSSVMDVVVIERESRTLIRTEKFIHKLIKFFFDYLREGEEVKSK